MVLLKKYLVEDWSFGGIKSIPSWLIRVTSLKQISCANFPVGHTALLFLYYSTKWCNNIKRPYRGHLTSRLLLNDINTCTGSCSVLHNNRESCSYVNDPVQFLLLISPQLVIQCRVGVANAENFKCCVWCDDWGAAEDVWKFVRGILWNIETSWWKAVAL